jgi:hypothetical protein
MLRNIVVVFTVLRDLLVKGVRGPRAAPEARVVGFAIHVKRQAKHAIPGVSREEGMITV